MTSLTLTNTPSGLCQRIFQPANSPLAGGVRQIDYGISAGFPSPAADYVEDTLDLNSYLVQHKAASFFFRVEGECMINAGIHHGDKVLVDQSLTPSHGHIVIAVVDSEYTLKRLHWKDDTIELRPENPRFKPIKIAEGSELQIWGVVTAIIRKLST